MEKNEKKSFFGRILNFKNKTNESGKRLYSNTKQTTTKVKLALLDLLNTKNLSEISITSLVKIAGVYRATFYLHYKSLNDVVLDIEQDVVSCYKDIKNQMKDIDIYNNMDIFIDKVSEYIKIDKKYLSMIINTGCFNSISLMLVEILKDIIITNFTRYGHFNQNDETLLNIVTFTGSMVYIYREWINSENLDFELVNNYIKKIAQTLLKHI